MFRLRTTVSLSVLSLVIGIAGTAWLSTFTDAWKGPTAEAAHSHDPVRRVLRRHAHSSAAPVVTAAPSKPTEQAAVPAKSTDDLPALTPTDMPPLPTSLFQRAVFASGRVVLKLSVDGNGRVNHATVSESSGNAGLDDRALRTVQRWRFAVPSDHPDGLSGTVVMRFDDTPAASL